MNYPTITVRQPWATLLAYGRKEFETRSWPLHYRGPLAIHASSMLHPDDRIWAREDVDIGRILQELGYADVTQLPVGAVLAVGTVVDCVPTADLRYLTRTERALGDFSPGRWAWRFARMNRLREPVPARGRLGLWACELDYSYGTGRWGEQLDR